MIRPQRVLATAALTVGLAGCWPAPGAGPDRRSFNGVEQGITAANVATFTEQWTARVGFDGGTPGSPLVPLPAGHPIVSTKGTLFVTTERSAHAFDPSTGVVRWQRLDGAGFDQTVQQLPGDLIAFGIRSGRSDTGTLVLDARTGAFAVPPVRPPLGSTGLVDSVRGSLVATRATRETGCCLVPQILRVADIDDPSASWEGLLSVPGELGPSALTLGDDRVFDAGAGLLDAVPGTGTFGNAVRSFPARSGAANCGSLEESSQMHYACAQWITPLDGTTGTPPVLSSDHTTLYTVSDQGTVYAIDTTTGAVEWSSSVQAGVLLPPALAYGTLFVPTVTGQLVAVDAADGSVEWRTAAISEHTVQPAVAGGVVFTGTAVGDVMAFDAHGCGAATCAELWSDNTGSRIAGAPAISLGKVFVGTNDGRLIAYGPSGV
ncbi:MAG TPA: PQQ-binding-like beta-propeller repeat protein [Acidimicrobiales bacterium]|nr:PQQ-binding-like beta-propeller repeat protein [Acidimicrobiales bacterium]